MSFALQEKMESLETRTDSLEKVLGQFISSVNKAMIRMEAGTEVLREEMKTGTEVLREEMKAGTEALRKELQNDSRKLRKEIGRLDNKIGMLAEDMVAPNIPGIAAEYFGDKEFESFASRFYKRKSSDRNVRREFDVIAISDRHFFVCEVKSNPRPEYAREFSEMLGELPDYFPEIRERRVIPIFASLTIPGDLVSYLSRRGIYAMGLREDTMDLLNFGEVREHSTNP
ncbi:MAG: hypothetical protein B6245_20265 [Desulfobacteraceae bacterium 4572_88]|nr:MAG: hypothetical protein B6245_20265 [Desulfobacteraceae bacterium 4572_88]